jgi:hypothetical protein
LWEGVGRAERRWRRYRRGRFGREVARGGVGRYVKELRKDEPDGIFGSILAIVDGPVDVKG